MHPIAITVVAATSPSSICCLKCRQGGLLDHSFFEPSVRSKRRERTQAMRVGASGCVIRGQFSASMRLRVSVER